MSNRITHGGEIGHGLHDVNHVPVWELYYYTEIPSISDIGTKDIVVAFGKFNGDIFDSVMYQGADSATRDA